MNEEQLTGELARLVMGWKLAPARFLKADRGWTPRWHFQPFTDLVSSFKLLDKAAQQYVITRDGLAFNVEVQIGSRRASASGHNLAHSITTAVCIGIDLALPNREEDPATPRRFGREPRR